MTAARFLAVALALFLAACERAQSPVAVPSPTPPPPRPTVASTPSTTSTAATSPSPGASPATAEEDEGDDIESAWGTDFEVVADASQYYGFPPMDVQFTARPLNGSPPYTYTWNFGDGSPEVTGETAAHRYDKLGEYHPFVLGKDANGETYRVEFVFVVVTMERYSEVKNVDIERLKAWVRDRSASPTPTP